MSTRWRTFALLIVLAACLAMDSRAEEVPSEEAIGAIRVLCDDLADLQNPAPPAEDLSAIVRNLHFPRPLICAGTILRVEKAKAEDALTWYLELEVQWLAGNCTQIIGNATTIQLWQLPLILSDNSRARVAITTIEKAAVEKIPVGEKGFFLLRPQRNTVLSLLSDIASDARQRKVSLESDIKDSRIQDYAPTWATRIPCASLENAFSLRNHDFKTYSQTIQMQIRHQDLARREIAQLQSTIQQKSATEIRSYADHPAIIPAPVWPTVIQRLADNKDPKAVELALVYWRMAQDHARLIDQVTKHFYLGQNMPALAGSEAGLSIIFVIRLVDVEPNEIGDLEKSFQRGEKRAVWNEATGKFDIVPNPQAKTDSRTSP